MTIWYKQEHSDILNGFYFHIYIKKNMHWTLF